MMRSDGDEQKRLPGLTGVLFCAISIVVLVFGLIDGKRDNEVMTPAIILGMLGLVAGIFVIAMDGDR